MASDGRIYVYANNKIIYHIILFACFVVAILLIPYVSDFLTQYIQNAILLKAASYVVAYVGAIYILPEIAFMIARMTMD
jgi:uncharacterized membrane protein required for colicin V production